MSSCDESDAASTGDDRALFVKVLKNHSILLNRSMTPSTIKLKENSWVQLKAEMEKRTGKICEISRMRKKLNNMKADLKKKTDKNQTGNRQIKLLEWEKELMQLMNFDENPVFNKVPGAISVGLPHKNNSNNKLEAASANEDNNSTFGSSAKRTEARKTRLNLETNETKNLTTSELQRLVLLEQLKLTRMQMERETILLDKMKNTKSDNSTGTMNSVEIKLRENIEDLRTYINL